MQKTKLFNTSRWKFILLLVVGLLVVLPGTSVSRAATTNHASSGIACEVNETNNVSTFTLTAKDGYISLADGNTVYMWSYAPGDAHFQFPGPFLCVTEGNTVNIVLHNELPENVSIIFPGQVDVMVDGAASQPVFDAGELVSLTKAAAPGQSVTYSFIAEEPGTYLYNSGTNMAKQVQMGLAGMLIVRPTRGVQYAYNRAAGTVEDYTEFSPSHEYAMIFSEVDPLFHQAVERDYTFDMDNYHPRYWLINGRAYPDTLAPNDATWVPNQPYGSLVHIYPFDETINPQPALIRYASIGTEVFPHHPHGNHNRIIARDGQLLEGANGEDLTWEAYSIPLGPGQTWDATLTWMDAEGWDPSFKPVPIDIPQLQNVTIGLYYSGSPYLGEQGDMPPDTFVYNQCGEYYHIAHNHALQQITAWGIVMSGQITYTRIDPLPPNNCP